MDETVKAVQAVQALLEDTYEDLDKVNVERVIGIIKIKLKGAKD